MSLLLFMNIENQRSASIVSSRDDSQLVSHSHYANDMRLMRGSYNHVNRFSSEVEGDDYTDTNPELSSLIKRPAIIPED